MNSRLKEDIYRYFQKTTNHSLIKLSQLQPSRARTKGIENAQKYMELAYEGKKEKRKPITVEKTSKGKYKILDGNSTYAVAKNNSWLVLPCYIKTSSEDE